MLTLIIEPRGRMYERAAGAWTLGRAEGTSSTHGTMGGVPLTLVLGPANSAKAGDVLGAFATASGRGAILVVPTAPGAAYYARELAADGAVLGSVLTSSGLAREVANRAGDTRRRLTPLQRERVHERARGRQGKTCRPGGR